MSLPFPKTEGYIVFIGFLLWKFIRAEISSTLPDSANTPESDNAEKPQAE